MKLVTGTVVEGKVSLPEGEFVDGCAVTVLSLESGEPVQLSEADEVALAESFDEVRRGRVVEGTDLVARLKARGR